MNERKIIPSVEQMRRLKRIKRELGYKNMQNVIEALLICYEQEQTLYCLDENDNFVALNKKD